MSRYFGQSITKSQAVNEGLMDTCDKCHGWFRCDELTEWVCAEAE